MENIFLLFVFLYQYGARLSYLHLSEATYSAFRLYSFSMCVPWELNPRPFALLMQCSTTEQQEHIKINVKSKVI